ncbi:MAG: glycosyltransferase family 2 protein [Pseudomonadota bacterium]|nr:glycosyltransferase family 2 protein [Pseudomonadota bacterium]
MNTPVASVIITTYNSPRALRLVLAGYCRQDRQDFEVVVADDGSRDETRLMIEEMAAKAPIAIRHVWQPDDGFQKCRILNKAIIASASDYIIMTDGDCVPRADFVSTHIAMRERGRFLSGALFRLSMPVTEAVTEADVETQRVFDAAWLRANGQPWNPRKFWKITRSPGWARIYEMIATASSGWNGANSSCWKDDALRVNGFDERMGYGALDREFGHRLVNAGITGKKVRYRAV